MALKRTEGIILQTFKFQDYDQIVSVFTLDQGIQKFFIKGAYRSQNGKKALSQPLARAEFVYVLGKSNLYPCREVSLLNTYLNLRHQLSHIETASNYLQAIQDSQMENKAAPELYKLLIVYLEKIPVVLDPRTLAASFYLKILKHEGLLSFDQSETLTFSEEEKLLIQLLAFTRSFSDLSTLQTTPEFIQKIRTFFNSMLQ